MAAGKTALKVEGLRKRYRDKEILRGVSLNVPAGEVFGLLGPNGAGKSTFIQLIANVLQPDAGKTVYGKADDVAVRDFVGVVPQEEVFYRGFSVKENLDFFGLMQGVSLGVLGERSQEVAALFGLESYLREKAANLSGGYRRLLNIACSMMHLPKLLILDEPTVALDPRFRHALWQKIRELKRAGHTVILCTHYMEEAEELCDEVALIAVGRILVQGRVSNLVDRFGGERVLVVKVASEKDLAADATLLSAVQAAASAKKLHAKGSYLFVPLAEGNEFKPLEAVTRALEEAGLVVDSAQVKKPGLEDVFLHLTGESHRRWRALNHA